MLYPEIDLFMKETGLDAEPAFDYLHFVTEGILPGGGATILGLYYPTADYDRRGYIPPSTIILPPDGSPSTLLHELGHRYGHFYHNDLSELFAEKYRKAWEKRLNLTPSVKREVHMQRVKNEICEGCPEMKLGRSRLCMYCEGGGAQLRVEVLQGIKPMARGAVAQTITGQITKIEVLWQGAMLQLYPTPAQPVKIPAGEDIKFYVTYQATNPGGGFWATCATMITTTGQLQNYDITNGPYPFGGTQMSGTMLLDAMGAMVMPNQDTTIRFSLWGHPYTQTSPPPQNTW